jgi:hypothetical protein
MNNFIGLLLAMYNVNLSLYPIEAIKHPKNHKTIVKL